MALGSPRAVRGVRARIALLLVLAFLPIAVLAFVNAGTDRAAHVAAAKSELHRIAELATAQQQQLVDETRSILTALAQAPAISSGNWRDCRSYLRAALPHFPAYDNLGVIDTAGIIKCSAVPTQGPVDVSNRDYFQNAMAWDDFASSAYQIGRVTQRASVNFSYPVFDQNQRATGVVFAALDVQWLNGFVARVHVPHDATMTVFDPKGTVIASHPGGADAIGRDVSNTEAFRLARSSDGNVAELVGSDGVRRVYVFDALDGPVGPIAYIAMDLPTTDLYADASTVLRRDLVALALVAVFALVAAWVASSKVLLDPIRRLTVAADRLGGGDLGARVPEYRDAGELTSLARSFNTMAASLSTRTMELHDSVRRLNTLHAIDRSIISGTSLAEISLSALEGLRTVVRFQRAAVHLFDRQARTSTILTVVEDRPLGAPAGSVIPFDDMGPMDQFRDTSVVSIDELARSDGASKVAKAMAEKGIQTTVTLPLRTEDHVIGCLAISSTSGSFAPEEIGTTLAVTDQLAIALTNAQLRDHLVRMTTELEGRLEDLRRSDATRRQLLGRLVHAQEEERHRIAEDIHDDSVQAMVAAALRLGTMRLQASDPAVREALAGVEERVARAIDRLRNFLFELSPQFLERDGVAAAIRRYAEEAFSDQQTTVVIEDDLAREPAYEIEFVVYRTLQGALGNVRAHANASNVRVELGEIEGGMIGRVIDDGIGFEVAAHEHRAGHLGLDAMKQRVELTGGWLRIDSTPGSGTTVEFFVPNAARGESPPVTSLAARSG